MAKKKLTIPKFKKLPKDLKVKRIKVKTPKSPKFKVKKFK